MIFDSTQPVDNELLMRVSEFHRHLADADGETTLGSTRLGSLNPSLLHDLQRFAHKDDADDGVLEVLEVLAAAVRHARPLLVHLQHDYRVLPLTVFPSELQMHCPLPAATLLGWRLTDLRVLHVEPARIAPYDPRRSSPEAKEAQEAHLYAPLGPLLWELALRGARDDLLPEIAGTAAYRVAPGVDLSRLDLSGSLAAAVQRLKRRTTNLRDIASWPGFDRERAMRLLNGLYLHAALMVSRSHPAATNQDWVGGGQGTL